MSETDTPRRHWSFIVTDARYMYVVVAVLFAGGLALAFVFRDPTQLQRIGNFVIGVGVWMSMRTTLRDGINRTRNLADRSPVIPGTNAMNPNFFNREIFLIGDALLQVRGFVIVVAGSIVAAYGDLALRLLWPSRF